MIRFKCLSCNRSEIPEKRRGIKCVNLLCRFKGLFIPAGACLPRGWIFLWDDVGCRYSSGVDTHKLGTPFIQTPQLFIARQADPTAWSPLTVSHFETGRIRTKRCMTSRQAVMTGYDVRSPILNSLRLSRMGKGCWSAMAILAAGGADGRRGRAELVMEGGMRGLMIDVHEQGGEWSRKGGDPFQGDCRANQYGQITPVQGIFLTLDFHLGMNHVHR